MSQPSRDTIYESDYRNVLKKIDRLLSTQTFFGKSPAPAEQPASPPLSKSGKPRVRRVSNAISPSDYVQKIKILHYQPEEIEVVTTEGFIVIHGKSGDKEDEYGPGFVSRGMTRRLQAPDNLDLETVTYCLKDTPEGRFLTIMASAKQQKDPLPCNERIVPIVVENPSLIL